MKEDLYSCKAENRPNRPNATNRSATRVILPPSAEAVALFRKDHVADCPQGDATRACRGPASMLSCVGLGNSMSMTVKRARRFERPVIIRTDGNDRMVVDVNTAAEILLRAFPHETARRKVAMAACLRVIRGEAHPPFARQAFVSAALDVGILAGD